jgi:hypothetical protein
MKIYIASSYRNLNAVALLRNVLRDKGHTILDWTEKTPPPPDAMSIEERRRHFDADESGAIFRFCLEACGSVDLVIYLGPAGQDSACEVGVACASGVPVYGVAGPLERPGLILTRCVDKWFADFTSFFEAIDDLHFKMMENE